MVRPWFYRTPPIERSIQRVVRRVPSAGFQPVPSRIQTQIVKLAWSLTPWHRTWFSRTLQFEIDNFVDEVSPTLRQNYSPETGTHAANIRHRLIPGTHSGTALQPYARLLTCKISLRVSGVLVPVPRNRTIAVSSRSSLRRLSATQVFPKGPCGSIKGIRRVPEKHIFPSIYYLNQHNMLISVP